MHFVTTGGVKELKRLISFNLINKPDSFLRLASPPGLMNYRRYFALYALLSRGVKTTDMKDSSWIKISDLIVNYSNYSTYSCSRD